MEKTLWKIWSIEHDGWWSHGENGYTKSRLHAGVYTFKEATRIVENANRHLGNDQPPYEAMVMIDTLEAEATQK